jgi:hypothetical protein
VEPGYDRVNALTLAAGVDLDRGGARWLPDARLRIRYRSIREVLDGDLELLWSLGRNSLMLRGGRAVRTNDGWINSDIDNSLYSLIAGVDTRNYYDARFVDLQVSLDHGAGTRWTHGLGVGWERARTLENRDPYSLFTARAGGFQPNLPASEGDLVSLSLESSVRFWGAREGHSVFEVDGSIELADADLAGDFSFGAVRAGLFSDLAMWWEHELRLEARVQFPISESPPSQRWRALGGWGSLPTLVPTGQAGEQMWWAAATYSVPLTRELGPLGRLLGWVQYAAGNAWSDEGERPSAIHDIALGATLGPLAAGLYTAPADDFKTVLSIGFQPRP